jgi:hypothetical protein
MLETQFYVKAKGYKETFKSLKLANTSYNRLKKLIQNEKNGFVQMFYKTENGDFEILKEIIREQ